MSLHPIFHNGCTNLLSYQECIRVSFSCQHLLFFWLLNITILTRVGWHLIVVMIISDAELFSYRNIEHFFSYAFGHLYIFFWEMSSHVFAHV
jgi:hypothetical protein